MVMQRILVIGNGGAGKSTLARALSQRLDLPCVELDALYWGPGWTPRLPDDFPADVARAAAGERWVIEGNYGSVRALLWPRADTIVWLDYTLPRVLWRGLVRTLGRIVTRRLLWNGNRESVRLTFFSRHSILRWIVTDHGRRRRSFSALRASGPFAGKTWHVHRTPRETARWLASLQPEI